MLMYDPVHQRPAEGIVDQEMEEQDAQGMMEQEVMMRQFLQEAKMESGHRGPREMVDERTGQGGVNQDVNQRLKSQAVQMVEKPVLAVDQDVEQEMKSQALQVVEMAVLVMDQKETRI